MPKLRDRKALAMAKCDQQERQSAVASAEAGSCQSAWSRQEQEALMTAIRRHGTFSVDRLLYAVPSRSEEQVRTRMSQLRRERQRQSQTLPIDVWLDRIANALPPAPVRGRAERLDVSALTLPLQLAAQEEHRQAAVHKREDLSGVYEYLAYVANGKIPPEPSGPTSRRLLVLMHHLAALMKNISLSLHKRWLWCNQRLRRLENEHLGPKEEGQPPPADATDLSVVPPELRGAMAALLRPETNRLQTPAALLLSPLATQLNERVTGHKHSLLSQPVHALLADAKCHQWGVSWRGQTGKKMATYSARTSTVQPSTVHVSTAGTSCPNIQISTLPSGVYRLGSSEAAGDAAAAAEFVPAAAALGHFAGPLLPPAVAVDTPGAVVGGRGACEVSTPPVAAPPAESSGATGPPQDDTARERHSSPATEHGLFATPGMDLSDGEEHPSPADQGVQRSVAVVPSDPAVSSDRVVPTRGSTTSSDPAVPSLVGTKPGRMTEADARTGPSFAVNRGGRRTYTRNRLHGQPQ